MTPYTTRAKRKAKDASTDCGPKSSLRGHGPYLYDLLSVVVHTGQINSGHYISFSRENGQVCHITLPQIPKDTLLPPYHPTTLSPLIVIFWFFSAYKKGACLSFARVRRGKSGSASTTVWLHLLLRRMFSQRRHICFFT